MIMRKCPKCKSVWFSADESRDWVCDKCGAKISKKLNKEAK